MARRFVRVDLSDLARDFRPVAVEPGVPLLDHAHASAKIVSKWLGGLAAEPEWEGESVSYFVCDDQGGRLEEVACQTVAEADLQGPLKADLDTLRARLSAAKPETSTERGVHKALLRDFANLVDAEHRSDRDNYFFRYKDANGRWRLVWCWGYQRVDQQSAVPTICGDSTCNLLFVRRSGQTAKCPSCAALQSTVPPKPKRPRLLVGLLLVLLGLLLVSRLVQWNFPDQPRSSLVSGPIVWPHNTDSAGPTISESASEPAGTENHGSPVSVVAAGETTERFQAVKPSISDNFVPEFIVTLDIAAALSDEPLEYRAYAAAQSAPETWTTAKPEGDTQRVSVASPPIRTGSFSTVYDLIVEARNPADGSIEQYPLRFRLAPGVAVQPPAE